MGRQLLANLWVNLVFFRRNNMLLVMALLIAGVGALGFIPSLIFETSTVKFSLIQSIFGSLDGTATVVAAVLGMLAVSHHLRSRCLKMVITKPCTPDAWLLSVFLSGIAVTGAIYLVIFLAVGALFLVWGVPFQWGLPFLAVAGFLEAVVVFAYLSMLTVLLHPVLAVLVALFFQDATFRQLITIAQAGTTSASGGYKTFLEALDKALSVVYLILPSFGLFGNRMRDVHESYRVSGTALQYLSLTFAYAALLAALFYLVGAWALRRKRLI
ncbi:MAG TPA: hypothetical protein VN317_07310 [Candidatus Methanoperedens sp.]|nr:hypothetical protein [Candidatus Methanoperedens sp.]